MKVEKKNVDELNLELTVKVSADDYAAIERKMLSDRRRTAEFKGFRKGMVPASLIKRIYGEQALVESVNQVVGSALDEYIRNNSLHILGEPLGSENQPSVEWKDGADFDFVFDVALSPEINVEAVKEDEIPAYNVTVSAADKKQVVENLKKYYEGMKKAAEERKEKGEADAEPAPEKTAEEIEKEASERLVEQYKQEAEWRQIKDIRDYFVKKAGVRLPEDFLKRWLITANEGKVSKEDVEKEFPGFVEDFKWQLVRGWFLKKFDIKVEPKDVEEAAAAYVRNQYAMYGLSNMPENLINDAAKEMLGNRQQVERLQEQVEENKVMEKLKGIITLKAKKISSEKFRELK